MIIAIDFNHQTQRRTIEVNDKTADWFLPQEFVIGKLAHAQNLMPDFSLGGSRIFTIGAGKFGEVGFVGDKPWFFTAT